MNDINDDTQWNEYQVFADEVIEDEQPLITIESKSFINRGSLVTIMGKPKCCKTYMASAVIGALLNGDYMNMHSHITDKSTKVIFCDTEQKKGRTQMVLHRINKMCSKDKTFRDKRLIMMNVRKLSPSNRMNALEKAIRENCPCLVLIDGIRDLLGDFNDIKETAGVIEFLQRIAAEIGCAIVVIIHQNKGDNHARGHLGSELLNKSETVVELTRRTNNCIVISPSFCRDIAFPEFAMSINSEGMPELCDLSSLKSKSNKGDEYFAAIKESIIKLDTPFRKEVCKQVAKEFKCSEKTISRYIDKAEGLGILEISSDNQLHLCDSQN